MTEPLDVLILGAGGAGLSAALEVGQAGGRALVLDAADQVGGSTALSGGVVLAAGTQVQREAGIEDAADAFLDRYLALNRWQVEPGLARVLCEEGAEVVDWLVDHGVTFFLTPANTVERVPRSHVAAGEGAKIVRTLQKEVERLGVDVRTGSRAVAIEPAEDRGWRVELENGECLAARALVFATGGIGQSPEMMERFYPSVARFGEHVWSVSAETCVGDGLALGESVGAGITGHDQGLGLITPGFERHFEVVPPAWLVFIGRSGRRYVDEMAPYSMLTATTQAQEGGTGFAILDEVTRAQAEPSNPTHLGIVSHDWNRESIDRGVERGLVVKADDVDTLAGKLGVDAATLAGTLARYNADCEAGRDSQYGKHPKWMRPVATPPFYGAEIRPCLVPLTCCGLRIDPDARVLTDAGAAIPGLFAAGETTGGVMRNYGGSGNSIANALVFGRRAGKSAAAWGRGS